jgi:8-oxo-dGTP pyrophosphatase MutT (NUDIX family)
MIRPAASVMLAATGSGSGEWRTLYVRRHAKARFMRGSYVFPGGCLEDYSDIRREEPTSDATSIDTGTAGTTLADFRRCAVREALEEVGIEVPPSGMRVVSHWTTPSYFQHRYNTWFFVAPIRCGTDGTLAPVTLDCRELTDAVWLTPRDAIARHCDEHDEFTMPLTTLLLSEWITARWATNAELETAVRGDPASPVPQLPEHCRATYRVDSSGLVHWGIPGRAGAPHLTIGRRYQYPVSRTLYPTTLAVPQPGNTRSFVHVLG